MQPEILNQLISNHKLENIKESLLAGITPAFQLIKQPSRENAIGVSRMGGLPDAQADFVWPQWNGRPLSFLAQINCAEIASLDTENTLPSSGLFLLFYDIEEQPWGFAPQDKGGSAVIYMSDSPTTRVPAPEGLHAGMILPGIPVTFHSFLSVPPYNTNAWDSTTLPDEDWRNYLRFSEAVRRESPIYSQLPLHQLLGNSANIQGEMEMECQLASHGIYCGTPEAYYNPRAKELEKGAADWRLLFQFDSDDDLNVMWGDSGMIYFWIRDEDLQQHDFTKTWTILQCC